MKAYNYNLLKLVLNTIFLITWMVDAWSDEGLTIVISPNSSQFMYENGRWTERTREYLPVTYYSSLLVMSRSNLVVLAIINKQY